MSRITFSKLSIRHTIQAFVGLLLVVVPLASKLVESHPTATYASATLGFLLTLFSNGRVVLLAKDLLDALFPEKGGSSLRHTLQAGAGLALIVIPEALDLLKTWPNTTYISSGLGFLLAFLSNPRYVLLVKTVLDLFLPADVAGKDRAERK